MSSLRLPDAERIDILLVDDRPENLVSLDAILDSQGYNLVHAGSGREALRCLLARDFALILLDVQMPGMDGFETAQIIRLRERSRSIPIIFVTAIHTDETFVFKGYTAGAVDYISKPLNADILRSKVAVFAELYRNRREIQKQAVLLREKDRLEREAAIARLELENLKREQVANERYKNLVEGIEHGIVWSAAPDTLSLHFVSQRAELVLGYPISSWFDKPDFILGHVHPEDRDAVEQTLRKANDGYKVELDHRFIKSNGAAVWVHTAVRLAYCEDGGSELQGLSIDISHLKKVESALKEAVRIREDFLSIASHELQTPLVPMKLHVQMMKRSIDHGELEGQALPRLDKMLSISDRQIDRMSNLIQTLMDVTRISHGKLVLDPERFDLTSLVHGVHQWQSIALKQSESTVSISAPNEPIIGLWDRIRIEQVVTNLLSNAARYGLGKPVEIELAKKENRAVFRIRDRGIGIPHDFHKRIFERYERGTASSRSGGLGLGLFITSEIVEAHGGSIEVDSEVDRGTVFTVELPMGESTLT